MIRYASLVLLITCAGCMPGAPDNAADAAGNAVANAVVIEARPVAPTPSPAPVINAVATPDNVTTEAAAGANGLPADVQAFIERREGCEHWAGEPDYDAERRKQIADAVDELCPGIDKQLAALRKRYARDPQVIAALADLEPLGMED